MPIIQKRSISPSPANSSKPVPTGEQLKRSSSEESIRVIHKAVFFPSSPQASRVTYIRRPLESDAELIRRQQAVIALQPLTFAEELAAKRKQLQIRAEKRKLEKAAASESKQTSNLAPPVITIIPASGKTSPSPASPTKMKVRVPLKEKAKATKPTPIAITNRQQRSKQVFSQPGLPGGRQDRSEGPRTTSKMEPDRTNERLWKRE